MLLGLEVERTGIGVVQAVAVEFDAEGAVHQVDRAFHIAHGARFHWDFGVAFFV